MRVNLGNGERGYTISRINPESKNPAATLSHECCSARPAMQRLRVQVVAYLALATAAALFAAVGCAHHAPPADIASPSPTSDVDVPASNYWVAGLMPPASTLPDSAKAISQGRADISINPSTKQVSVLLFLTGLNSNQAYLWHIRRGICSAPELAGPPSEYSPLAVDNHGRGTSTGQFLLTDPALNFYHIDVHTAESGGRPSTDPPVVCGEIIARKR